MHRQAPPPSVELLREIATEAASAAADLIRRSDRHRPTATKSTDTDIVTETDIEAEQLILEIVSRRTPGSRILAEERGHLIAGDGSHGDVEWVIDPLDGTVNFSYRVPLTAVSVAAVSGGRAVAGAVVDVAHGEVFSAARGLGAHVDGTPISVGRCADLALSLLATGYAYHPERRRSHGDTIGRLLGVVRDVRAFGSAALHLCWVASGRLDAYVERDIKPWDYAAGSLIASEAGAVVELPCVENDWLVVATNDSLYAKLRPHLM